MVYLDRATEGGDVKGADEAVAEAKKFFGTLYTNEFADLRVEEIELSEDRRHWLITLGFGPQGPLASMFAPRLVEREYKSFSVNTETGQVESMKIRVVK